MYKIVCDDLDVKYTYVGSTENFTRRKAQHKMRCKDATQTLKLYTTMRENGGFDNLTMVKIETCMCDTKLDARKRERYWYEKMNANLNELRPHATREEIYLRKR